MPAVEVDNLRVFQIGAACRNKRRGKHARVEIVHHIQQQIRQILRIDFRKRIRREHRNTVFREHLGQVVIH